MEVLTRSQRWRTVLRHDALPNIRAFGGGCHVALAGLPRRVGEFIGHSLGARMIGTTRAALVASARSGSTWLVSLLDSHPEIRFEGELFNLEHAPRAAISDPAVYLATRLDRPGRHRIAGCKILYHQGRLAYLNDFLAEMARGRTASVDWRRVFPHRPVTLDQVPALPRAWEAIRDRGRTRIIHLRRRNLLRQHLSLQLLMAASRAGWRGRAAARPARMIVATDRMLASFGDALRTGGAVAGFFADNPTLDVFYEDVRDDPHGQCERILGFLDVRRMPLRVDPRPRARPRLRQVIENYDEVADALRRAGYTGFLDDG